jgi:hypothetical protein
MRSCRLPSARRAWRSRRRRRRRHRAQGPIVPKRRQHRQNPSPRRKALARHLRRRRAAHGASNWEPSRSVLRLRRCTGGFPAARQLRAGGHFWSRRVRLPGCRSVRTQARERLPLRAAPWPLAELPASRLPRSRTSRKPSPGGECPAPTTRRRAHDGRAEHPQLRPAQASDDRPLLARPLGP